MIVLSCDSISREIERESIRACQLDIGDPLSIMNKGVIYADSLLSECSDAVIKNENITAYIVHSLDNNSTEKYEIIDNGIGIHPGVNVIYTDKLKFLDLKNVYSRVESYKQDITDNFIGNGWNISFIYPEEEGDGYTIKYRTAKNKK